MKLSLSPPLATAVQLVQDTIATTEQPPCRSKRCETSKAAIVCHLLTDKHAAQLTPEDFSFLSHHNLCDHLHRRLYSSSQNGKDVVAGAKKDRMLRSRPAIAALLDSSST